MAAVSRLLRLWLAWVLPRPRLVLGLVLVSAVASVILAAARLDIHTDQLELISPNLPLIRLSDKLEPFNFGGKKSFTVVIEAPTPSRAVSFVNRLMDRVGRDPEHFQGAWYRVDPNLVKPWALLYLDRKDLLRARKNVGEYSFLIRGLSEQPDLLTFFRLVNEEMATRMVGELFTGFLKEEKSGDEEAANGEAMDLGFLIQALDGIANYLKGTPVYKSPWASFFESDFLDLDLEGYFWEGGKRLLLAMVVAKKQEDGFVNAQDSIEELRRLIHETRESFPDVQAGVTGEEALNTDEMTTVLGDMSHATWLSFLGVLVLMVVFFRGFRRPLIEMVSLTVGICWTLGWTTLFIGHLNILSIVFAPLLSGLGVDYGIHWLARFEEEEAYVRDDMQLLIHRVTDRSGPGIFLAGLSAAFSFLPFVVTKFVGLMELGLITGFGTLLLLLANFTVLPAVSVLLGSERLRGRRRPSPKDRKDFLRLSRPAACVILTIAVGLCALAAWGVSKVRFDLNPLRLQASNAESVIWEKKLIAGSKRSNLSAASFATSPAEAEQKARELEALPSVSEVESVFSFLPKHQEEKVPLVRSLASLFPAMNVPTEADTRFSAADLAEVLERIRFKMQEDRAAEWGAEKPEIEQMSRVRNLAGEIIRTLNSSPASVTSVYEYQKRFLKDLTNAWDIIRHGADVTPMQVRDIPDAVKERYLNDGLYMLKIYPKDSIWEQGTLSRFVQDLEKVDPEVVGDPVALYVFAAAYKRACIMASIYAVVAILILLVLTFRFSIPTLLALAPLAVGTLWTVGIMGAFGFDFNLANSIFMPLVVGAGVEYGIIILNRWQEGRMRPGHLPHSTAKGVTLAALTTTVGFGTLMISHHRGIFSLGFVAWAGSLCVLLAAIVLLPALLAYMKAPNVIEDEEVDKK